MTLLMRVVIASPDESFMKVMESVLDSALCLTPLDVSVTGVHTRDDLYDRVEADLDDIILLDWQIAGSETPQLVQGILQCNPRLRLVALLPESYRQYRQQVWAAGACNGIPKEYVDQEWLSTVLCIMHRAMQREARLLKTLA